MTDSTSGIWALSDLGFLEVGEWRIRGDDFRADISSHGSVSKLLYAFCSGSEVLYIGKSTNTLAQRMAQYEQPGPTQRTNIRNNRDIRQLLLAGERVRIMVFVEPEPVFYRGYRVNLAAGLEDELIQKLQPKWNKLGKSWPGSTSRSANSASVGSETHSPAGTELSWGTIRERIRPGAKIRHWSKHSGYLEGSFTISAVGENSVEVDSPGARNTQIVPAADFSKVLAVWAKYMAGDLPRHKLRDMTRFSTYIISIIRHVSG